MTTATLPITTLARKLRKRQRDFFALRWRVNTPGKYAALDECKQLEADVLGIVQQGLHRGDSCELGRLLMRMILAQRKYFESRNSEHLRESTDYERRVDRELDRLEEEKTPNLFA